MAEAGCLQRQSACPSLHSKAAPGPSCFSSSLPLLRPEVSVRSPCRWWPRRQRPAPSSARLATQRWQQRPLTTAASRLCRVRTQPSVCASHFAGLPSLFMPVYMPTGPPAELSVFVCLQATTARSAPPALTSTVSAVLLLRPSQTAWPTSCCRSSSFYAAAC